MISADYERIKQVVGDIYEENLNVMNEFPINVFKLAKRMGFRLISASEIVEKGFKKAKQYQDLCVENTIYGYQMYDQKNSEFVIYYDDLNSSLTKMRFSVAHEIGHIVLGHSEQNGLYCYEQEREAEYFASYLICPDCIATNDAFYITLVDNIDLLMKTFGLSRDAAIIKNKELQNRHKLINKRIKNYEKIIYDCIVDNLYKMLI